MTDGLKPEYRRAIIETLSANPKVERIVLFGSRAMGTFTPTSDIDLALFGDDLTLSDQAALTEAMAELAIPQRVDILIHHRIENQALRDHIRKHGVEWFARKRAAGTPATVGAWRSCASNRPKPPNSTPPSPPTARSWGMAGEWREVTLGDAIELKRGYDLPSRDRREGPFPIVSSSGISGRHTEAKAKAPGVVIGRYGTLGEVYYITEDYWPLNTALYVRDFKGNDPRFVSYFLRCLDFTAYSDKAAVPGLNRNDLHTAQVLLPPLPEQRAIAHILGTLDDKIELNRRMSETLEAMARALFKSWFVDFDPVRAKAEGRDPGLPQPLADLFPDSFEDSELGEIPKGWEVGRLGDLVETVKGRSYKSEELVESDTALVTLKSFARGGGYRADGLKPFTGTYKPTQVVQPGEIIMACTDVTQAAEVIGRPAMVRQSTRYQRLVASLDVLVIRAKSSLMTRSFTYLLCTTDTFAEHTYAHTTGTTVLHLAKETVPSFRLPLPTAKLIQAFDRFAAPTLTRIQQAELESELLAALRDALLPKLISGEMRVKDAERFLKERAL